MDTFGKTKPALSPATSLGFGLAWLLLAAGPAGAGGGTVGRRRRVLREGSPAPPGREVLGVPRRRAAQGRLKLTSRADVLRGGDSGPAAVAGKPEESLLVRAVRYQDEPRMPPKGKLTDRQIEVLERWVKLGLPWPGAQAPPAPTDGRFTITEKQRQFWSFQPVKAVPLPAVRDAAWPRSAVDRFILAGLEAKGLAPAAPADKRTLLRRATFDLIGLPPTPAEIDAFLADDSPAGLRPGRGPPAGLAALRRALGPALARRRPLRRRPRPDPVAPGERLPRGLALPRLGRRSLQPRPALHGIRPLPDRRRPAAAAPARRHQQGRAGRHGHAGHRRLRARRRGQGPDDRRLRQRPDRRRRPGLPGAHLACARCHDHKFDPISTEDYYALAGIFFSTRLIPGPVPGNTPLVRVPLLSPAEIAQVQAQDAADARRRAELEQQLPDAADREYLAYLETPGHRADGALSRGGLRVPETSAAGGEALAGRSGETARASRGLAGRVGRVSRPGREAAAGGLSPDSCATRRRASWPAPTGEGGRGSCSKPSPRWPSATRPKPPARRKNRPWPAPPCSAFGRTIRSSRPTPPAGSRSGRTAPACPRTPGRQLPAAAP